MPIFLRRRVRYVETVLTLSESCSATAPTGLPEAMSRSTWYSRSESAACGAASGSTSSASSSASASTGVR